MLHALPLNRQGCDRWSATTLMKSNAGSSRVSEKACVMSEAAERFARNKKTIRFHHLKLQVNFDERLAFNESLDERV